ncbi:hypothetical protein SmJEL517_g05672 [Synchytrium microbalum]|uniref:Aldehyde dehydrogenase domain-containing protein n=1 Tax=Synchytrium microbalum TaxID=1806994 RepID=A0A507BMQ0_9FUNG|nr:uncharacterized protein SmJEL517_g05672 [Synchytrium microbalum]TPX30867.1 hypothetical protein SmJEL517_g05672 [Synchytrium microbalum]
MSPSLAEELSSTPKIVQNWIDGAPVSAAASTSSLEEVTCPATGKIIAMVPVSSVDDVNQAVSAAKKAFVSWSARTVKDRVQILMRYHQLVIKHADELADLIVLEHGKNKLEALQELSKANETVEYSISLPQLMQGKILEVSRGVFCEDRRSPLGVVVSIVPFNFPAMVPHWTMPIAIATGNTFILKTSEKVPLTMCRCAELLKEAGLPDGVFNVVHGTAETVTALIDHKDVVGVTFVGSTPVAEIVAKRARALNKRVLALGGAKNHLVAAPDCNIEMTSSDVVASYTGCTGQRCMAASVLLTLGPAQPLLDKIIEKSKAIQPGQTNGKLGPVIDKISQAKILKYINEAEAGGAKIVLDGRGWSTSQQEGNWVGPTIVIHSSKADRLLHEEAFGPVLSIYQCESKEEAIEIENGNPYGNAACIYTENGGVASWFNAHFSAGMLGVNIGVPVPREPFSFGGWNRSKFGDMDITGDGGIEFFTNRKKVTTKWAPPPEASWMS